MMELQTATAPFTHHAKNSTGAMMLWVILACIPGFAIQTWYFGYGNLFHAAIAMVTALVAEALVLWLRRRAILIRLRDNSALVTALLLAVCMPPCAPWWITVLGTAFAIIIAKQLYGGLGHNLFNPAMTGYAVLLVSFPLQMTTWPVPVDMTVDAWSQATPLEAFKTGLRTQTAAEILQHPLFQGVLAEHGWQWINTGFLAGGLFLLWRRIIHWHIPVSFLLALTVCATAGWLLAPERFAPPLLHLFSGATMLGAFFIATDPVSAAATPRGRLIFGSLCGSLVWLIRVYGNWPDAVAFAVLSANLCVPLIDSYTQPRVYGSQ